MVVLESMRNLIIMIIMINKALGFDIVRFHFLVGDVPHSTFYLEFIQTYSVCKSVQRDRLKCSK